MTTPLDVRVAPVDIAAIAIYFLCVLLCGLWSMCRANRGTVSGYFLAGRFMTWLPAGASLFASNIGAEHFIGLAGSGAAAGIGVGAFELNALIVLQLLGWVFLPVYIASGVYTLPEFMSKRFGGQRIRIYLAVLSLILYVFTKISVNMYAGALFVGEALGWNLYLGICLILAMTAVCTLMGGLAAVVYTDTLQCFLMIFGGGGLAIYSLVVVGGYSSLVEKYMQAIPSDAGNNSCGYPKKDAFVMLRGPSDVDLPWPGFILGQSPASIWYWAADQMMVQRVLATKSLSHAQGATIFAGYLKILPLFLIILPGMVSRVLYTDTIACVNTCQSVCGNAVSCSNYAYPKLVMNLMPDGARGVLLAVMLAALISDLTSVFNSAATLFTIDLWRRIRQHAGAKEMLTVGRVFVLFMVLASFFWVPVIQRMQGGQLYIYIQSIAAYLSPPIAAVYLLAILWKRCNEQGAFCGLMVGFVVGCIRMVLDFTYREPRCGEPDLRPLVLVRVHYMYFAIILFWLTTGVSVAVSMFTLPLEDYRLVRTTYWTRKATERRPDEGKTEISHEDSSSSYPPESVELRDMSISRRGDDLQPITVVKPLATDAASTTMWSKCCLLYNSCCGWDDLASTNRLKLIELQAHLKKITSLEQTSWQYWVLNFNLIFILAVAVFLYVFFSVDNNVTESL